MKIIGEKINATRPRVAQAVQDRDAGFIQDLAWRQAEAEADWLDVNTGTPPDREPDDLVWLVRTVQEAVDVPLCLDSAIMDPLDRDLRAMLLAAELVLGHDRHCLNYIRAYRAGRVG